MPRGIERAKDRKAVAVAIIVVVVSIVSYVRYCYGTDSDRTRYKGHDIREHREKGA